MITTPIALRGLVARVIYRQHSQKAAAAVSSKFPSSPRVVEYKPLDTAGHVADGIRARRSGPLLNLDRMLLHSEPYARGWNAFLKEVRCNLSLDPALRELAICVVALANEAPYEFEHHKPILAKAGDWRPDKIAMLERWEIGHKDFTDLERDVANLTWTLTKEARIRDGALMARLKERLGETGLVELVGVVGAYNCVSRFLNALEITSDGEGGDKDNGEGGKT